MEEKNFSASMTEDSMAPSALMAGTSGMKITRTGSNITQSLAMAYIPVQNWETPYPVDKAFEAGTIFPSLNMPFTGQWKAGILNE